MKIKNCVSLATLALMLAALPNFNAMADDTEARVAASRGAVTALFDALKTELVAALKAGSPADAIPTCNLKAIPITQEITEKKGWRVARTSLKLRNPANAPDAWERGVLEKFEAKKLAGENPAKMEFYEVVMVNDKKVFRYMKAIPTAKEPCLLCHGSDLKPEVVAQLKEVYPQDQARDYKEGDIRGAFTISQPLE